MVLEPNSLDWNGNELEHELELEDMKCTIESFHEENKQYKCEMCDNNFAQKSLCDIDVHGVKYSIQIQS